MHHIIIVKMFETLKNSTGKRENHQYFPERTTANYNNERLFYCFGKPTNSNLTWELKLNVLTRLRSTRNSHTTVSLAESLFSR